MEPEQWLQRHPEAGLSWPSWPKASHGESDLGAAQSLLFRAHFDEDPVPIPVEIVHHAHAPHLPRNTILEHKFGT